LDACASPFSYETGFYFRGKKTFDVISCGMISICGGICLFSSFIVLFGPVIAGSVYKSELNIIPFNTPANIPIEEKIGGGLDQFFGR